MNVFSIQRFSIQDGPGIRTTVFLKGCSLECPWCHNPEGIKGIPQLMFHEDKCVQCGLCALSCPLKFHSFENGNHLIQFDSCIACGQCVSACGYHALEIAGKEMDEKAVLKEILRDRPFYGDTGGVTFSGGEPLLQSTALSSILQKCKELSVHTAVETALNVSEESIDRVLPYADLMICDLKTADSGKLSSVTKACSETVFSNLKKVLEERKGQVWVRTPIIPGFNDEEADIVQIGEFLKPYQIDRVELLPYHDFGKSKYHALHNAYRLEELLPPSKEKMNHLRDTLSSMLSMQVTIG